MATATGGSRLISAGAKRELSFLDSELNFVHELLPNRVLFGSGRLEELGTELDGLGLGRGLIVCTEGRLDQAEMLRQIAGNRVVEILPNAKMHVPLETATLGIKAARKVGADCTIAIGGGSTIGLAKAIALETRLPIIAVPTTFSGSEMTPIWGLTDGGIKKTGRNSIVMPKLTIYDPDLTADLPVGIAGPSGMNAIAHCVEALYSVNPSPIISLMALEGISALRRGLSNLSRDNGAKAVALYGSWLAGACLGTVSMALHHKLCHVLGGAFGLSHAQLHTVLIPHVTAFNQPAAPNVMKKIAVALDTADAALGLYSLAGTTGSPRSLKELGMRQSQLKSAAKLATRDPYDNPRQVTEENIMILLADAFEGGKPRLHQTG